MKAKRLIVGVLAVVVAVGLGVIALASDMSREPDHAPDFSNDFEFPMIGEGMSVRATLLSEDFEGGVPPAGWTVVDNLQPAASSPFTWTTIAGAGMSGNNTNGSGECASANSDGAGSGAFDIELRSPVIDCSGAEDLALSVAAYYENYLNADTFDIDISANGGTSWTNVLSWNEDHGTEDVLLDVSSIADGAAQVMVRFRYYDLGSGYDWYVQVDDVALYEVISRAGIPTLGTWGIVAMLLALAGVAVFLIRRRA